MFLDFFDLAPVPVPHTVEAKTRPEQKTTPAATPSTAPANAEIAPETEAAQAGFTPKIPKNPLENVWRQAMGNSLYLHPHGRHQIQLQGQHLIYKLVRSPRRSVGFMVGGLGLEVRASPRVNLSDIEGLLQERSDWILRHLDKVQDLEDSKPQQIWADGASCPLHGQAVIVRLNADLAPKKPQLHNGVLHLPLPASASASQIERSALDWYGAYAHAHFAQRLDHYAASVGVRWTQLKLSNANTRWGSAKRDGSIRLHWRLVQLAPELLDYVVIHELAHLHEMNHSPRFWAIVAQHCPNYLALRKQLKNCPLP
jgi:hypothetical protein